MIDKLKGRERVSMILICRKLDQIIDVINEEKEKLPLLPHEA